MKKYYYLALKKKNDCERELTSFEVNNRFGICWRKAEKLDENDRQWPFFQWERYFRDCVRAYDESRSKILENSFDATTIGRWANLLTKFLIVFPIFTTCLWLPTPSPRRRRQFPFFASSPFLLFHWWYSTVHQLWLSSPLWSQPTDRVAVFYCFPLFISCLSVVWESFLTDCHLFLYAQTPVAFPCLSSISTTASYPRPWFSLNR